MAIRRRAIHPDMHLTTRYGEVVPYVSDELLIQEVSKVAIVVNFAGGWFSVQTYRHETGIEHERVTGSALITWEDRVNARAQAEPSVPVPEHEDLESIEDLEREMETLRAQHPEPAAPELEDDLAPVEGEDLSALERA